MAKKEKNVDRWTTVRIPHHNVRVAVDWCIDEIVSDEWILSSYAWPSMYTEFKFKNSVDATLFVLKFVDSGNK